MSTMRAQTCDLHQSDIRQVPSEGLGIGTTADALRMPHNTLNNWVHAARMVRKHPMKP